MLSTETLLVLLGSLNSDTQEMYPVQLKSLTGPVGMAALFMLKRKCGVPAGATGRNVAVVPVVAEVVAEATAESGRDLGRPRKRAKIQNRVQSPDRNRDPNRQ